MILLSSHSDPMAAGVVALFGGFCAILISMIIYFIKKLERLFNSKKYPMKCDSFPVKHLFIGDTVHFEDGRRGVYRGYYEDRLGFLDGDDYFEVSWLEIQEKAIRLSNSYGLKWTKNNAN